MELFKRERRVNARMKKCQGKMVRMKGGSGDEGARKKVVKIEMEVPITKAIREMLDPKIQGLIQLEGTDGAEQEFAMNKIEPAKQVFPCIINMFSKQNWSAEAKPLWTAGGEDVAEQASIYLKSIAIKEDEAVLRFDIQVNFTEKVWSWAGDSLDGCDCVMKFKPLAGELFKDQQDEEEDDDEDVRPSSLKNKEKEKEAATAAKE